MQCFTDFLLITSNSLPNIPANLFSITVLVFQITDAWPHKELLNIWTAYISLVLSLLTFGVKQNGYLFPPEHKKLNSLFLKRVINIFLCFSFCYKPQELNLKSTSSSGQFCNYRKLLSGTDKESCYKFLLLFLFSSHHVEFAFFVLRLW